MCGDFMGIHKCNFFQRINLFLLEENYNIVMVFAIHQHELAMEKAMAPHSSVLAWKIPWMEEPGRLQSMGLPRVGYD